MSHQSGIISNQGECALPENPIFLSEQIITYIGNKRSLLSFIGQSIDSIKKELHVSKLRMLDVFSGSGIVSRYFKQHATQLYTNDLESYCNTLNRCYLSNKSEINFHQLEDIYQDVCHELSKGLHRGFISELYAPADDTNIQAGERVFYTTRNAMYIDTCRQLLEEIDEPYKTLLLAPLLVEASIHNNTSGVFKGFYKNAQTGIGQFGGNGRNALQRIMGDIQLPLPILSNFECEVNILQEDANKLYQLIPEVDIAYLDPPYNQHPYGSNYFMLNLINNYQRPTEISKVSGIPEDWNKSDFNSKKMAQKTLENLCASLPAKYLVISFNSEGFISKEEMIQMLNRVGTVNTLEIQYNTFKGSRNLNNRDIHVTEFLFIVKKN